MDINYHWQNYIYILFLLLRTNTLIPVLPSNTIYKTIPSMHKQFLNALCLLHHFHHHYCRAPKAAQHKAQYSNNYFSYTKTSGLVVYTFLIASSSSPWLVLSGITELEICNVYNIETSIKLYDHIHWEEYSLLEAFLLLWWSLHHC